MPRVNYKTLQKELVEATRLAFDELRQQHAEEEFYCFALYTNEEYSHVVPTAHSEEALAATDETFRWSPCDWKYHCQGELHFDGGVQEWLDANPVCEIDDDDLAEKHSARIMKTLIQSLQQLDAEGFFGVGLAREKVVILILMGDQDNNLLLECAEQLNPASVFQRFAEPFRSTLVGKFSEIGSRKVYQTNQVCVSADGSVVATVGSGFFFAFQTADLSELFAKRVNDTNSVMAISPDGTVAAVGWQAESGRNGGVHLWSIRDKKKLRHQIPPLLGGAWAVRFAPDGQSIATCGRDRTIRIWKTTTGEQVKEVAGSETDQERMLFSPDLKWLATTPRDCEPNSLRIWRVDTGELSAQFDDCAEAIAFSPDGTLLAVASAYDEKPDNVRIWDLKQQRLVQRIEGLSQSVDVLQFSYDGRQLAIGTAVPAIAELWDLKSNQRLLSLNPNYNFICDLAFLRDGRTIAVAGRGISRLPILLWDISDATTSQTRNPSGNPTGVR